MESQKANPIQEAIPAIISAVIAAAKTLDDACTSGLGTGGTASNRIEAAKTVLEFSPGLLTVLRAIHQSNSDPYIYKQPPAGS